MSLHAHHSYIIGIGGVTNGGKTTLALKLAERFHGSVIIHQDDFFKNPEGEPGMIFIEELNHYNWDDISAINIEDMIREVISAKVSNDAPLIFVDGILLYDHQTLNEMFSKRYFLTLPYEDVLARRLTRTYDPPDPPNYFRDCAWPAYEKHLERVQMIDLTSPVEFIDGNRDANTILEQISKEIQELLHGQIG